MPNIGSALKIEISRLAKREIRHGISALRRTSAAQRSHIAKLKRRIGELERQAGRLSKLGSRTALTAPVPAGAEESARFQARGFRSLRKRLDVSQSEMARLLGVSALSVYNWEGGKAAPRRESLAAIVALRRLGKREAQARLAA